MPVRHGKIITALPATLLYAFNAGQAREWRDELIRIARQGKRDGYHNNLPNTVKRARYWHIRMLRGLQKAQRSMKSNTDSTRKIA